MSLLTLVFGFTDGGVEGAGGWTTVFRFFEGEDGYNLFLTLACDVPYRNGDLVLNSRVKQATPH